MRMGEFNSDDHYIYYCGQESFRRNGVAPIVNKSPECSTWVQSFFFFLLYNIVIVLPYINMHPSRVYTCSPS